ncbi:MAG: hypothetical protein Q8P46_00270 [Hyphomicrobiales bacterium]|nr:hypothetical protein [Hyphomicrobiales bacterium]
MKRPIEISKLIRWSWREELPKAQALGGFTTRPTWSQPGWAAISKAGVYGVPIQETDIRNRYGVVPDFTADRNPHPDATTVWWQVQDLAHLTLTIWEDWNPIDELGLPEARAEAAVAKAVDRLCFRQGPVSQAEPVNYSLRNWRVANREQGFALRKSATEVVLHYATMGNAPEWKTEQPQLKTVSERGKPKWFRRETIIQEDTGAYEIEIDGYNKKAQRPYDDAYLKHYYDPDLTDIIEMRAEYEIWHAAIGHLVDQLGTSLEEWEPLPPELPARPWEAGAPPPRRILVDQRPRQPLYREPRPSAGPPPFRGIKRAKERIATG